MGKFLVRIITIFVAIYLLFSYMIAQYYGVDILTGDHKLLFELIVVVYAHSEGKFHCKYLKYTISGIFASECVTHLDYSLNFLSVSEHNAIPICLIAIGIGISTTKALLHFYKVIKIKQKKNIYGASLNTETNQKYE